MHRGEPQGGNRDARDRHHPHIEGEIESGTLRAAWGPRAGPPAIRGGALVPFLDLSHAQSLNPARKKHDPDKVDTGFPKKIMLE